jgi:hypothetical protein
MEGNMTNSINSVKFNRARWVVSGLSLALGLSALAGCRPAPKTPILLATAAPTQAPPATQAVPTQSPVPAIEATPTPLPPTASLPPTVAPPVATLVPTEVPTPDPNLGVGDVVYSDQFDGKSGWYWSFSDDAATFLASGGKLNATMKLANSYPRVTGGKSELKVGDQQLRVTAHPNACGPNDEYGVMFRVNADITDGYAFKIRCDGQARFEVVRNYKPTALVDWAASPAIVPGAPADNTLMIWAAKGQFHFYVNDKYLFSAEDAAFDTGTFGFVLNDRTAGGESVSFTDLIVKAVKQP